MTGSVFRNSFFAVLVTFSCPFSKADFALMGDAGRPGLSLEQLRNSVAQTTARNVVMPGDNLYSHTYPEVWDRWKKQGFQFEVVAIGNHNGGYKNEIQYFNMPAESYSKVVEGARFIVLNSDNKKTVSEQFKFLNEAISTAQEKLVFLVYHHPSYNLSDDHFWFEKLRFQIKMRKFLKKEAHRITAVIVGHDHMSAFIQFGNVPVILAGSGRAARDARPLEYVADNGEFIQTPFLAGAEPHWGYMKIHDKASTATVEFIRIRDQKSVCLAQFSGGSMHLNRDCVSF